MAFETVVNRVFSVSPMVVRAPMAAIADDLPVIIAEQTHIKRLKVHSLQPVRIVEDRTYPANAV